MVLLVVAACGTPSEGQSSETTTSTPTETTPEVTVPEAPSSNLNSAPQRVVDKAIDDLASRAGVDRDEIKVVLAEEKTWPDGSIGCPEPGMSYTQALVDGYRVLLEVDDRLYAFHAGSDAEPFLCESDEKDGGYDFVPPPGLDE